MQTVPDGIVCQHSVHDMSSSATAIHIIVRSHRARERRNGCLDQRSFSYAAVDLHAVPATVGNDYEALGGRVYAGRAPEQLFPFGHSRVLPPACLFRVDVDEFLAPFRKRGMSNQGFPVRAVRIENLHAVVPPVGHIDQSVEAVMDSRRAVEFTVALSRRAECRQGTRRQAKGAGCGRCASRQSRYSPPGRSRCPTGS